MSYVLELSGVVSYDDNTEKSFLAVDDIKDDIVLQDQQAFLDVSQRFRTLIAANGGDLHTPQNLPRSGKTIRETVVSIRCLYTIGQDNYEFTITSNDPNGFITTGNGNWMQFWNLYGEQANQLFFAAWGGASAYNVDFADRTYFTFTNNSMEDGPLIVGAYLDNIGPTLYQEFLIDPNKQAAFLFDFASQSNFWVHARRAGDPAPWPAALNTQISIIGIAGAELDVTGSYQAFNFGLNSIVAS